MISAPRVLATHLAVIAALVLANLPIIIMGARGHDQLLGLTQLVRLREEANLPSYVSALALGACAVVAFANCRRLEFGHIDRFAWRVLAWLFAFMSVDEAAQLHELANHLKDKFHLFGANTSIAPFVYLPVVIFLAIKLFAFWLRLSSTPRVLFATAGTLFVISAIGFEIVENNLRSMGFLDGAAPLEFSYLFEETGEMLAVAMFLYTFLRRFSQLGGGLLVPLTVAPESPKTAIAAAPRFEPELQPVFTRLLNAPDHSSPALDQAPSRPRVQPG